MNVMPGQRTVDAGMTPRIILMADQGVIELPGPAVLDSVNAYDGANTNRTDELLAGLILAQITASKKWVPCKRTQANGAGSSATALIVDNARSFVAGETLQIGSTTGVISSINYGTNTITLTAAKTWSDNDVVYAITAADGSTSLAGAEIARCILKESVRLLDGVQFSTSRVDKGFVGLIGGYVNSAMILSDYAAIIASGVTNYLSGIRWSHQQQP